MNWIQNLYDTYNNCQASIGYGNEVGQRPLLPICHITTQAHIEIAIDGEGKFRRARVISEKTDSTTIIPCTEGSASRSGPKPENHSLCDKLQYVAGDYRKFGGIVTSGFTKDTEEPNRSYIKTLTGWCSSDFAHPNAIAVLKYVKKKTVIEDLIKQQVLFVGSDGKLQKKENVKRESNVKDIFTVIDPQEDAFIRWIVEANENESRVWRDKSLWESWIEYYFSNKEEKAICYITGENQVFTNNHPKYIRREGDGAKLISSNDDKYGFTFRGRFLDDKQACGVGLEASQKAHYALAWLISRQGYRKGDLAIVAWSPSGASVPQVTDDAISLLYGNGAVEDNQNVNTAQDIALKLKKRIAGYGKGIGRAENIVVIALNSATPGRLAITYYRDLPHSDFLRRINDWHETCAWLHQYKRILDPQSNKKKACPFIGAPAPNDIAEAVYGIKVDDRLSEATISRLLPCIVDGQPIPRDLVESVVRRASNRVGIKNRDDKKYYGDEEYTWEKTLSIACSLVKKYNGKENFDMPLDETRTKRDYLYGRLLAIADILEERALYKSDQKRATNAARYMQQFSQRPLRTWKQLHDSLAPYFLRLGGAFYYKNLIAEVESMFNPDDFLLDKPLSGEYLLGFYCQRQKLLERKDKPLPDEDDIEKTES
jgi:CRISPR-associated protein Csd1